MPHAADQARGDAGPRAITVTAPAAADLLVVTITNPPALAAPGAAFGVNDTVKNEGATTAPKSTTRYYLSLDGTKDGGDTLMAGTRSVAALAPGAQSDGAATLTMCRTRSVTSRSWRRRSRRRDTTCPSMV